MKRTKQKGITLIALVITIIVKQALSIQTTLYIPSNRLDIGKNINIKEYSSISFDD